MKRRNNGILKRFFLFVKLLVLVLKIGVFLNYLIIVWFKFYFFLKDFFFCVLLDCMGYFYKYWIKSLLLLIDEGLLYVWG